MSGYKQVVLDAIRLRFTNYVNSNLIDLSDPKVIVEMSDRIFNSMAIEIHGYVWGQDIDPIEIKHPKDWFESFKERWFPKFLLTKYPVQYKIHRIETKVLYPNYKPALPEQEYSMRHLVHTWEK